MVEHSNKFPLLFCFNGRPLKATTVQVRLLCMQFPCHLTGGHISLSTAHLGLAPWGQSMGTQPTSTHIFFFFTHTTQLTLMHTSFSFPGKTPFVKFCLLSSLVFQAISLEFTVLGEIFAYVTFFFFFFIQPLRQSHSIFVDSVSWVCFCCRHSPV